MKSAPDSAPPKGDLHSPSPLLDEDTEATHTMLLISGGQLIIVGACAAGCWLRHRRKQAQQAALAAARKGERRARKRADKAAARLAAAEAARAVEV